MRTTSTRRPMISPVKNPSKVDETEMRNPRDIIAEMAALDAESAAILRNIEAML